MNISTIAQGYVLGKLYLFLFKCLSILFIPVIILYFCFIFSFTYKPSPKELENYPPLLSSEFVQESTSHLRYNVRVVLASFAPMNVNHFNDLSPEQIKNFPKMKDAFLTKTEPNIFREFAIFLPRYQKGLTRLYGKITKKIVAHFKDKPIAKLNWDITKK
jgi:hypothetical protein